MLVALALEAIGDNNRALERDHMALMGGYLTPRPWVCRLHEYVGNGHFRREFVQGRKDYSRANSVGSRGVYYHYALEPGVYEVQALQSWRSRRKYFALCDGQCLHEVSTEEAIDVLIAEKESRH